MDASPCQRLCEKNGNRLYIKRDDLIPYSFGGNKVRKAYNFFREVDSGRFDCIVTYGSGSSNHCRVVANMAAERGMDCRIISPEETVKKTFNTMLMELYGVRFTVCPVREVHETIESTLEKLRGQGRVPYFIPGGGHGNLGTQAYVDCFREIKQFETENNMRFDYIFHASGTGTTQAGLICGKLLWNDPVHIVGISIARKNPYGRGVVMDSVKEYLAGTGHDIAGEVIEAAAVFDDSYIQGGYGKGSVGINMAIRDMMVNHGIPMDGMYVGKAYAGMLAYMRENDIKDKNILFIHTGGTPLFFDDMKNMEWHGDEYSDTQRRDPE